MTMLAAFALHVLVKGLVITQASRRFAEDRQSGALEILLATPLPAREILDGQRRALRRQFGWLVWLLLFMNLSLTLATCLAYRHLHMSGRDQFVFLSFFVIGALLLFVDLHCLPWIAMLEALRGRKHQRVILGTLMRGLVPSWLGLFAFVFISMGINMNAETVSAFFWIWAMASSALIAVMSVSSRVSLQTRFRALAAGDNEPRRHLPSAHPPAARVSTPPPLASVVKG
jgi:hypothetical protein